MPASTIAPTPATKNSARFQLPSAPNAPGTLIASSVSPPATTTASTIAVSAWTARTRCIRCSTANTAINAMPIGSAAARHAFAISRAGVTMSASPRAYSNAGGKTSDRNSSGTTRAAVSAHTRPFVESPATSAVIRMCALFSNATTAPSIASHMNRIDASSSDHVSGRWKP